MITIPLDPMLSAGENAKKYFDKYQKLKRTYEALTTLTKETKETIDHLESVKNILPYSTCSIPVISESMTSE